MRSLFITILLLFFSLAEVLAQDDLQIQFGYRRTIAAGKYLPSTPSMPGYKFEAMLKYSLWVANTSIDYGSINKIYRRNSLTKQDVDKIVNDLKDENQLGVGQDFQIVGLGLKTKIGKRDVVWSFSISDRMNVNSLITKELIQLAWQGNKQFEGQTLDFSNTHVLGLYFREYSFGASLEVAQWENWQMRAGMRISYYQGLSGIRNSQQEILFTTAVGADYINMDYNFEYRYTGIEDFDFFDPRGHGAGINLGTSFTYKEKLNFDLGVTDLGSIKFDKKVSSVGSENDFTFSGVGLRDIVNPTAFLDSIGEIFTPRTDDLESNSFKMPVGARLSFMTSWIFGRTTKINGPKTLSLLYTQGFSDNPGVTTRPKFTLGFHRPVLRHFLFGISTSVGGFNNFALGGIVGMHFKHFRFSFQSDDFTGLIMPEYGTAGGGGFLFQLRF